MDSEDNEVISWIMKATKLPMNNEGNEVILWILQQSYLMDNEDN